MLIDPDISRRIAITKLLMVMGIVVTHIPPWLDITDLSFTTPETIKAFFSHALFRAAVPILAAISGYLLFSSKLFLDIKKLLTKKFRSIIIPLIIWNLPFAIIIFLLQSFDSNIYTSHHTLYPFSLSNWLIAVTAVIDSPINAPLYFLRDLFVISMLAPFYWMLFKNVPYVGLAVVLIIFYFNLDGDIILRDSMFVTFYFGILASTQQWNLRSLDKYAYSLLIIFLFACIYIVYDKIDNKETFIIFSPFLIWPALSKIVYTPLGDFLAKYTKYSFLLFLSHLPIMFVFYKIFLIIGDNIPYFVFWVISPLITIYLALVIIPKIEYLFPSAYKLSVGGR